MKNGPALKRQKKSPEKASQRDSLVADAAARREMLDRKYWEMFNDPQFVEIWNELKHKFGAMNGTMLIKDSAGRIDEYALAARAGANEVILHIQQRINKGSGEDSK